MPQSAGLLQYLLNHINKFKIAIPHRPCFLESSLQKQRTFLLSHIKTYAIKVINIILLIFENRSQNKIRLMKLRKGRAGREGERYKEKDIIKIS